MIRLTVLKTIFLSVGCAVVSAAQVQDNSKIALSGFSVSESFSIADEKPFDLREPNLLRLVYRLRQTSLANLEAYSAHSREVTWEQLLADPAGYRLQVFSRQARAHAVEKISLPDSEPELNSVYLTSCVANDGRPFQVLSLQCPLVWIDQENLNQPLEFFGFFYGSVQPSLQSNLFKSGQVSSVPLFLARQLSWYPDQVNPQLAVTTSDVYLSRRGVDLAGFDLVRRQDRKPLGSQDTRVFNQMLAAVGRDIEPVGDQPIDHMAILKNPTGSHGRHIAFQARVKKCSLVRPPAESQRELGLEQYYQLIVFPDLRDARDEPTTIEIGKGEEKLNYRRFPFTICCRELPRGMTAQQIENQQVWIDGFYFRFWQFDAERTREANVGGQLSPIIIAHSPQMIESTMGELQNFFNSVLLIIFGALAIVGWTLFRVFKQTRRSNEPLPDRIDIENLKELDSP